MSQLLGLSFDGLASPSITLRGWARHDAAVQPAGWGFAWYPSGDYAAAVIKDPIATGETAMTELLRDWDRFRANTFLCHLRGAAKRVSQEDTHPFSRSFGGRDWVFAHNGDLDPLRVHELFVNPVFAPVGHTDSERAFCWLLTRAHDRGVTRLAELGWSELHGWLQQLDALGTANFLLSDGEDLVVYRDAEGFRSLFVARRVPPNNAEPLANRYLELDLGQIESRTALVFATTPLTGAFFTALEPGQMLVARRGSIIWSSSPIQLEGDAGWSVQGNADGNHPGPWGDGTPLAPSVYQPRLLSIVHDTLYRYNFPVERSTHLFRLEPVQDSGQQLLSHNLEIFPQGNMRRFEDVFGNITLRVDFERPYSELRIVSRSSVRIRPPEELQMLTRRSTIPLLWMPWQRQMMVPYLLPSELPEMQLRELSEFAMSFAERQDFDVDETLRDMNQTIHRDFRYISGSTTLETTPYEVYRSRHGVCQDFANLFICLARLLNIPARYRVGYLFTGGSYDNAQQGDASHAWAEVYLPFVGWRGFDPTNGTRAGPDHIRVTTGRNFRDATPTSGTLLRGGGGETLEVVVKVTSEPDPGT